MDRISPNCLDSFCEAFSLRNELFLVFIMDYNKKVIFLKSLEIDGEKISMSIYFHQIPNSDEVTYKIEFDNLHNEILYSGGIFKDFRTAYNDIASKTGKFKINRCNGKLYIEGENNLMDDLPCKEKCNICLEDTVTRSCLKCYLCLFCKNKLFEKTSTYNCPICTEKIYNSRKDDFTKISSGSRTKDPILKEFFEKMRKFIDISNEVVNTAILNLENSDDY